MAVSGIRVKSEAALGDIESVMKLIFTPINAMVVLASFGNIFGKLKDQVYRNRQSRSKNYNCNCSIYHIINNRIKLHRKLCF